MRLLSWMVAVADIYVRTKLASELNETQRSALAFIEQHGAASVVRHRTGMVDGEPVVHSETAMVLLRRGFAEEVESEGLVSSIAVTEKGLRNLGKLRETPAQRRHRQHAESLEAQTSGKWNPAPAGASAQASSDDWWDRREVGEAMNDLNRARDERREQREMVKLGRKWGLTEAQLEEDLRNLAQAEDRVAKAEAVVERAHERREGHAA